MKKFAVALLSMLSMHLVASVAPLQITSIVINPAGCPVTTVGTLTVTVSGGQLPHTFTLAGPVSDGPLTVSGNTVTFSNLPVGLYTVTVQDVRPDGQTTVAQVETGTLVSSITATPVNCFGNDTGTITVQTGAGTPPISYVLNSAGVPPIVEQNTTGIFTDLRADEYRITVRSANDCDSLIPEITITTASQLAGDAVVTSPAHCPVGPGGTIVFEPGSAVGDFGGIPPYFFSIDGGKTFQASPVFTNVSAGVHVVLFKDSVGCETDSTELFVDSVFQSSGDPVTDFINLKNCDGCFPKVSS